MSDNLELMVESTIDEAIRTFDCDDPGSYDRWEGELQRLESLLREQSASPAQQDLLATVRAHRMALAFEMERFDLVLDQSSSLASDIPPGHPSFSNAAALRIVALHATGAHQLEIQEALTTARRPEIYGGEYVLLLAGLSKRHPGTLPVDEHLWKKLEEAVESLQAHGYTTLPRPVDGPAQIEEAAGRIAEELRRVNRERGEALLKDLQCPFSILLVRALR